MRSRILAPMVALAILTACGDMYGTTEATSPEPAPEVTAPEVTPDDAPVGVPATVSAVDGPFGPALTDADGRTLYLFTVDDPGVSNCEGGCLEAWPPLLTEGTPVADGAADAALIGTIERGDGTTQVTYADKPLYYFAADAAPGDINGQGVNDVWYVVAPDGTRIVGDGAAEEVADDGADDMTSGGGGRYSY